MPMPDNTEAERKMSQDHIEAFMSRGFLFAPKSAEHPLPHYSRSNRIHPILLTSQWEEKNWGGELTICNNDEFCGKILKFKKGAMFSCHFHVKKREVFWVKSGSISLMTINPEDASQHTRVLSEGDVIEIPRLCPHQITALEDSEVIEFSTHHEDSDSYRMLPGDSQQKAAPLTS